MHCPACARPVAMARANCVYCGAALSTEILEEASLAARRVLQTKSLAHLEAAAKGLGRDQPPRRYLVIDTAAASVQTLAEACSVSVWEARQWQTASRYRLVKVSAEPADGPLESGLKEKGLDLFVVPEETVARSRNPILLESIDISSTPAQCTLRDDAEGPASRRELSEPDIALIVSASIRREKVKDQTSLRIRSETRLEDAWLVHLHLRSQTRPWEIDPRRTGYKGVGLASAHMSTVELVRRLSAGAPHDEAFKNIVPALSPGVDEQNEPTSLKTTPKPTGKEPKLVVLDNVAQFREYSAWRGALEIARRHS